MRTLTKHIVTCALAGMMTAGVACGPSLGPECAALTSCCASLAATPSSEGASCSSSTPSEETACETALTLFHASGSCASIVVGSADAGPTTWGPLATPGSSDAGPSIGVDATPRSPVDATFPNGACNDLTNIASMVMPTMIVGSTPVGMGGTPIDGTYVLTALTTYWPAANPPSGQGSWANALGAEAQTISVSGSTWQVTFSGIIPGTMAVTATYSTRDDVCTITCGQAWETRSGPPSADASVGVTAVADSVTFTATQTSLVVYHTALASINAAGFDAEAGTLVPNEFSVGAALTFALQLSP